MKKNLIIAILLLVIGKSISQQNNIYQAFTQCITTPQAIPGNPPAPLAPCSFPNPYSDAESNLYVPNANSPTIQFRVNFVFLVHPSQPCTFGNSSLAQLQAGALTSVNYMNGKFAAAGNIPSILPPINPSPLVQNPKISLVLNNVYRIVDPLAISQSFGTSTFYNTFPYDVANTVNIYLYDDPVINSSGWASFGQFCGLAHTPGSVYNGGNIGGDLLWHELCHVFGFFSDYYCPSPPSSVYNSDPAVGVGYHPDDATNDIVCNYSCSFPTNSSMYPANNNVMGNSSCREVLSARQIAAFHYLVAKGVTTKYTQFSSSGYPYVPPSLAAYNTPNAYVLSGVQSISSLPTVFNSIIIQAGSNITINNTVLKAVKDAKIIVEPTAKLTLNCVKIQANKTNEFWEGIEVWGDVNSAQSVNSSNMPDYQGMLVVNNGYIQDAKTAICVSKKIPNGIDYTKAGGIVNSINSVYYNNQIGADFYPYFTMHKNPDWFGNRSFFKNDHFLFDGNYHDLVSVPPFAHIRGEGVYNIRVYGCSFDMIDITLNPNAFNPNPIAAYGIFGTDSRFLIKDYCPNPSGPATCNITPIRNTFNDFVTSIYLNNTTSFYASSIDHSVFNSNYGYINYGFIFVNNTKGVQITNNDFNLYTSNAVTSPSYGLYLNNCDAYIVENNSFFGTVATKNTGIYVNNSGPNANSIYNNKFDNLKQGLWTQNQNYDPLSGNGLVMNCNDFLSNTYHIGVQKGSKCLNCPNNTGVNIIQGIANTANEADNVRNNYQSISCGSENKFYMNTANSFAITSHGSFLGAQWHLAPYPACSNPSEITDIVGSAQPLNPTKSSYCPANFNVTFSSRQIGEQLSAHRANIKTLGAAYTASLDGGNTQQLLDAVNSNMSTGNLKSLLLSKAFLSDEVLNAYVLSSPPNGHLKAVHEKNAPVTSLVWQTILSQNLPNGILNQMQAGQNENKLSNRAVIQSQVQLEQREVGLLDNEKIRRFVLDTTGIIYDSIIAVYKLNELPDSRYDLVKVDIAAGNFTDAQNAINDLAKEPANADFCTLQQYALGIAKDKDYLAKISADESTRKYFIDQANSNNYLTEGLASALLLKVYGIKTIEERLEPVEAIGSRLRNSDANQRQDIIELANGINIFPSPANEQLNVSFETAPDAKYEIQITDLTGKLLIKQTCNNNCSISLSNIQGGIYLVNLYSNNALVSTKKAVIIK